MSTQIHVGLGVIVYNARGAFLVGRRKSPHGRGFYGFPGGHMHPGETAEECAAREAFEEAGITLANIRKAGFTDDFFPDGRQYLTLYMEAEHAGGAVINKEPHKLEEWLWVTWDTLPAPLFLPIENFLKGPFAERLMLKRQATEAAA